MAVDPEVMTWGIFERDEQVVTLIFRVTSRKVIRRDYGEAVSLGWPRGRLNLDSMTEGLWWR